MGIFKILVRILMFLGSLVFAGLSLLGSFFFSGSAGLFGTPHTLLENLLSLCLLIAGLGIFVLSFLLFRRNNTRTVIALISIISGAVLLFSVSEGLSQDIIVIYVIYLLGMIVFYLIDCKIINLTLPSNIPAISNAKFVKSDKKLVAIPLVILIGLFLYFGVISGWLQSAKKVAYQRKVISQFTYQVYAPRYVPAPYNLTDTDLGSREDFLFYMFRGKDTQWFTLAQFAKPSKVLLSPPRCSIFNDSRGSFEMFYGSSHANYLDALCRGFMTVNGTQVYTMQNPLSNAPRNYAVALLGSTLITVDGYTFSEQELGRLIDSLEVRK
ncbi:MAG: hypothetical protein M3Q44_06675 [bacterium]|nr:hypothetical protein [bacterium]